MFKKTNDYKAFIVPHTHWDREWYLTFQQFKLRLINTFENLFNTLENDEFTDFSFDGQTIILEDYLEVYPEKKEILKRYIGEDRIQVGPWYILPDEFLVSGEATIRNLLLGHKIADDFGKVMKIGYLPDPFGHISQMPQILQGFNIDNIIFWRGIDYNKTKGNEFIWEGPDGTELFAAHLPQVGYCNARSLSTDFDEAYDVIRDSIDDLLKRETSKSLLLLNGVDHLEAQPHIPELSKYLNKKFPNIEISQGNLKQYMDYAKETVNDDLEKLKGEFRSNKDMMTLNSVYSARMYIKQANERCQTLLENWAEPTSTFAWLQDKKYRSNLIWNGWKWLMKNHPHDSICGCSIDQVHKEMMTRFDWAEQIAEEITNENLQYITNKINVEYLEDDELALTIFNPLPYEINENINTRIKFSKEITFNRVKVFDDNHEIIHQLKDYGEDIKIELDPFDTPTLIDVNYADISFTAENIPAAGYKTYKIKAVNDLTMPGEYSSDIAHGSNYIENVFYIVKANNDGTVDITDKINNRTYNNCNRFSDRGDAGDEYTYSPPLKDKVILSNLSNCSIENFGSSEVTLKISGSMSLPEKIGENRKSRSCSYIDCPLETKITLYSKIQRIDFETTFDNKAKDHRLQVEFPTGIDTDVVYADSHFDVVKRPIAVPDSKGWVEKAYKTAHNSGFVSLSDDQVGVSLLNRGLPEYEIIPEKQNSIALTLLRSVGWLSVDDLEHRTIEAGPCLPAPEAQCLGKHSFSYALVLHKGNWAEAGISHKAKQYRAQLKTKTLKKQSGSLPEEKSYIEIENEKIEISSIKKHESSEKIILRIYNPTEENQKTQINLDFDYSNVYLGNLSEDIIEEIEHEEGLYLNVPSKKIFTIIVDR
ncbi:alpha-mannosidase [Halanaerobium kushneri]|jgi:mannosylglycerate hydrolase|uniref:Mannosylglycerate hydrolase n=1 Tax=Halanaerobium kushneri TaxID=56779 RepID=A0A1N6R167_9FIRM|nr:glycoside hydrolase family 38 C-terminal domain-containing protein [Halanaerobium kushneri]SIQ22605.1 mannosylglycerate hydrolase [Halanaerobium kushneri]